MASLPLNGIMVIDLGRVWAGPLTTRVLADFGAEVIKVESLTARGTASLPADEDRVLEDYPNKDPGAKPWNRQGMFNDLNRNKKSLALDLSRPEGVAVFKKLVAISDIVVENYTPRVMANFGLDYPVLKTIKPDLIMLSMPAYGATGPYRDFPGFGNTIESVAGITDLVGYAGGPPHQLGMIAGDPLAALHGVSAIMVALRHKRQTGSGQHIDLSQAETQTSAIGEYVLDFSMNKRNVPRIGNRHPVHAPHGCYRCKGKDSWVAIDITSETEWQSLCKVMGNPSLAHDKRFSKQSTRLTNQDELDTLITAWTIQLDHYEVMRVLQTAGVPCGPVLNGKELLTDPHLRERGFFVNINHPDTGTFPYAGSPIRLSRTPAEYHSSPGLGEHNREVLGGLLGMSQDEITALEKAGVIGDAPPDA
jgi:crotonobetainyl-CoA:carnitine CoA-transferase CaiB-like acyl-CoA transferase